MMIIDKLVFKKITSKIFMSKMLHLTKQQIEKQDFSIFLRDLASTLNINLKHMIEDNIKIEEKPRKPSSNLAIPGLYIYNQSVIKNVKLLKPSDRGELEITDLNNIYFKDNDIHIQYLDEGITWMDMGSFDSYLDASLFISSLEKRKGYEVYNPTE